MLLLSFLALHPYPKGWAGVREEKEFNCVYRVTKPDDLFNVIIPHFSNYPLLSQKYSDFIFWSKVVKLMITKEHLIPTGFISVLSFYASINNSMSATMRKAFPDILGLDRIKQKLPENLNPDWIAGLSYGKQETGDFL